MNIRIAAAIIAICMMSLPIAGCYQMGKATGQAVDSVEQAPKDFKKGYEEGNKN